MNGFLKPGGYTVDLLLQPLFLSFFLLVLVLTWNQDAVDTKLKIGWMFKIFNEYFVYKPEICNAYSILHIVKHS